MLERPTANGATGCNQGRPGVGELMQNPKSQSRGGVSPLEPESGGSETLPEVERPLAAPTLWRPAAGAFDGNRWNDLHYSRATKLTAKERKERSYVR